jgi:GNAT superfamily N-acetyltransferase
MTPMTSNFMIRPATPEDATEIARVNHETWIATYKGILSDEAIKAHSLEEQVALWQHQLGVFSPSERRFVAEIDGMIVGYSGGGRNPETGSPFECELFGIYVLGDYQGRGIGHSLIRELAAWLIIKGHTSMLVWILSENPYRRFYEKLGGLLLDQSREIDYSGKKVSVVCYGWSDLSRLA